MIRLVCRMRKKVSFKISLLYETLSALIAREISHTRMYTLVRNKIRLCRESLVALVTRKMIFHRFGQMTTTVNVQSALLTKRFATLGTNVWAIDAVYCTMCFHDFLVNERFAALFATEINKFKKNDDYYLVIIRIVCNYNRMSFIRGNVETR